MKRQRPSLFVGFRRYQRFFPFWKQKTHHNPFFRVRTRSRQWWIFKLVLRNKNFKKKSKTPLSARGLETVRLSEETRGFSFSTQLEEGGMRFNLLLSEELTWRSCCSTTRNCPYFRMRLSFFSFCLSGYYFQTSWHSADVMLLDMSYTLFKVTRNTHTLLSIK